MLRNTVGENSLEKFSTNNWLYTAITRASNNIIINKISDEVIRNNPLVKEASWEELQE